MKLLYLILGLLSLTLGTIGVIIPILPTTPFYLLAAFCLAKSSKRLHNWFLSTLLYERHLKTFVKERAMSIKTKISIMMSVTLVLIVAFLLMGNILAGQITLIAIWLFHTYYFVFRIKTIKEPTV